LVKPEWGVVNDKGRLGWVFDKNDKSLVVGKNCEDNLYGL
jgi:hypothetical protein